MSRCFPYPPVGYCRNGASYEALIESIKLQKETNKTKADRKKEKKEKKDKRHKEKRNKEDKTKSQKNTNADHLLQKTADFTKAQINGTNATSVEPFEKSDLTEEHGPSISSQQPCYSYDSTQNSNKRKRDDAGILPADSSSHGKPIKIRFLKKHKGSDSVNFVTDAKSGTHLHVPSSMLDENLVSRARKNGVSAKISDPNMITFCRIQSAPSSAKPIFQSTRPQNPTIDRPVFLQFRLESEIPSSLLSRNVVDQKLGSDGQQQAPPSHRQIPKIRESNKVNVSSSNHKKQKEDAKKVIPTRYEKKMMKQHAKYEKLLGSLLPPVFDAHMLDAGEDDEDWLCRSKISSSFKISKGEVVETCRQSVAS